MGSQSLNDLFGDLPDYPGKKQPKNRQSSKESDSNDPFKFLRTTEYIVRGEKMAFYTIGELAKALNRKPVTLRQWEARGYIPTPTFRTPPPEGTQIPGKTVKGRRLYSRKQVELLIYAVDHFGLNHPRTEHQNWVGFKQYVKEQWSK
jgi:hypothetical protein